ncbi:hypothetical protein BS78_07G062400 [Paspalum vaginatum]|nr:hypothetical protein BS78_07G062400 [Paspalum vaginatum]
MAAASDSAPAAVAFLETSLGTRFAVSFPSRGTTVADLKPQNANLNPKISIRTGQVSAEHSACFPGTGPISVTSLQVRQAAIRFRLPLLSEISCSSAAFSEGTWHLRVEADQLPPRPAPAAPARTDPERGTTCDADAEAEAAEERSASAPVSLEPSQNMEPSADPEPEGGGDLPMHQEDSGLDLALALAAGYSDKEPTSHQGTAHQECLERPSGEDGSNMQLQSLERLAAAAAGNREIPPPSCQGNPHPQGISHASSQSKDENIPFLNLNKVCILMLQHTRKAYLGILTLRKKVARGLRAWQKRWHNPRHAFPDGSDLLQCVKCL